jgi:uncharacterized protein with ATP-grasp and redox domains
MDFNEENNLQGGIAPDCYPCVVNQALSACRFAGLNEEQTRQIVKVAEAGLEESKTTPILVQHVVRRVTDAIIAEKGESPCFDIYAEVKEASNLLALDYAESLRQQIDASLSPLETGLRIAAAGNIIDFGAKDHASLDLEKEIRALARASFKHYDFASFRQSLQTASTLLYLCDNSGEIVFDMLFIKQLQREYPDLRIVAALRDKPIINDATLADAVTVGLDRLVTTISSGSIYPGTILNETTDEFRQIYEGADLILSKGQGNFETLLPLADDRVFFLLRIKCDYMAVLSGVERDNLVLMRAGNRDGGPTVNRKRSCP